MSGYLSIRFELVWAFCADGASVQILYHVYIYVNEGSNVRTRNEGNKININKRDVIKKSNLESVDKKMYEGTKFLGEILSLNIYIPSYEARHLSS